MDYAIAIFFACLWGISLAWAWGLGWESGYHTADENHKWSRWILRRHENRNMKF